MIIIIKAIFLIRKLWLKNVKINTDAIIAGKVNKSPTAAIMGVVTLSGSQPWLKLLNEINIVNGSIIKFDIIAAIHEINMKSINEMES